MVHVCVCVFVGIYMNRKKIKEKYFHCIIIIFNRIEKNFSNTFMDELIKKKHNRLDLYIQRKANLYKLIYATRESQRVKNQKKVDLI